jgi:hypothetical protein
MSSGSSEPEESSGSSSGSSDSACPYPAQITVQVDIDWPQYSYHGIHSGSPLRTAGSSPTMPIKYCMTLVDQENGCCQYSVTGPGGEFPIPLGTVDYPAPEGSGEPDVPMSATWNQGSLQICSPMDGSVWSFAVGGFELGTNASNALGLTLTGGNSDDPADNYGDGSASMNPEQWSGGSFNIQVSDGCTT